MNKRLRQLAIESGFDIPTSESVFNGQILSHSLDRFIRRVVEDIEAQSYKNPNPVTQFDQGFKSGQEVLITQVKKHFGVEE